MAYAGGQGYNPRMAGLREPRVLIRVLAPLILALLLGVSPRALNAVDAMQRARLAVEFGQHLEAAAGIAEAATFLPYRGDLWELAGEHATLGGDDEAAITYFLNANNLTSHGRQLLGETYLRVGDSASAIRTWEGLLNLDSLQPSALDRMAAATRQSGDFEAAVEYLRQRLASQPGQAAVSYQLGLLLAVIDPPASREYFLQAMELDEAYGENVRSILPALRVAESGDDPAYARTSIGQALGNLDEWDLAAASFEAAVELSPDYAEAWAYLGEARQHLEQEGKPALDHALTLDPNSLSANLFTAIYWQRQGDYDAARSYLEEAIKLEPDNPALLVDMGALSARLGDLREALGFYRRAIELASNVSLYWQRLAAFCVDYEVFLEGEGLPAALEAVQLAPKDPSPLVLAGRAYFLLGDNPAAYDYYLRALALDSEYAPTYLHLGLYYFSTGDAPNAEAYLRRALALDPEGPTGFQAQRVLAANFP